MTPECAEQFQRNASEVKLERVRAVEVDVDEDHISRAMCYYCGKSKPIIEIVRNFGRCDHDARYGNV